jgi:hypothetical protein
VTLANQSRETLFLLVCFLLILTIGVSIGLGLVIESTHLTSTGTIEQYNGSAPKDEFDILEHYPKPIQEMLMTTHSHVISFSFIFLTIGYIFSLNTIIKGKLKIFFIIEPFIAILTTFGGIWLMRFVHQNFVYLIIPSGILMYASFYIIIVINLIELLTHLKDSK